MPIRQRDTTDIGAALGELDDALFGMGETQDDSEKNGYTVTQGAYDDEQQQAQQALIDLMHAADALVGEMDVYIDEEGNEVVLSNPPLERGPDGLPQFPGGSGGA
jgi:hypothetical protein